MEILKNIDENKPKEHLKKVLEGYKRGDEISILTVLLSKQYNWWGNEFDHLSEKDIVNFGISKGYECFKPEIHDMFKGSLLDIYGNHKDFYVRWTALINDYNELLEYEIVTKEASKYNNIKKAEMLYHIALDSKDEISTNEIIDLLETSLLYDFPTGIFHLGRELLGTSLCSNIELAFKYFYEAHLYNLHSATTLLKEYLEDYPISLRGIYTCLAELYLGERIKHNICLLTPNYVRSWKYCKLLIKDAISDQCGVRASILLYTVPQFKAIENCQNAIVTIICIWKYRRNTIINYLPKDLLYYLKDILWSTKGNLEDWKI